MKNRFKSACASLPLCGIADHPPPSPPQPPLPPSLNCRYFHEMPWVALDFEQRELKVAAAAAVCWSYLRRPLCCTRGAPYSPQSPGDSEQGFQSGGHPHAGSRRSQDRWVSGAGFESLNLLLRALLLISFLQGSSRRRAALKSSRALLHSPGPSAHCRHFAMNPSKTSRGAETRHHKIKAEI